MIINKKVITTEPSKCYLLFDHGAEMYRSTEQLNSDEPIADIYIPDNADTYSVYTGEIRIFTSLLRLNDHLLTLNPQKSLYYIDRRLYKGYMFPGIRFPLELPKEDKDFDIFVIEKTKLTSCFAEQVESLKKVTKMIEDEINAYESRKDNEQEQETDIRDFLVFIGEKHKISYCTTDSNDG